MDNLCYLCLGLPCFLICSLLPCGQLLGKVVMFTCVFVTFTCGILSKVCYLIVLIPDFCCLSYFNQSIKYKAFVHTLRLIYMVLKDVKLFRKAKKIVVRYRLTLNVPRKNASEYVVCLSRLLQIIA